ncbi:MAG: ParB N-terminal domain-containing protein [Pseudomonadota bacterium]
MDGGHLREIKEIEIAQLKLRYAHTRIERPKESLTLASSIERVGQIIPVIVVREEMHFVLLDGYLRVKALRHCGRDTAVAEIWECKEEEAIVEILARAHSRRWDFLEEAALLQELHEHYQLSQSRIASMVGRKQSWVSMRLALYQALSEELVELIRKGSISTWAASRVIVPIARAIPAHGKLLSENLAKETLSTREMATFLHHYRQANRKQRENMVRQPVLFLKSLRAQEEGREARALKEGLEGKWLRDFRVITQMLKRLLKEVHRLFSKGQDKLDRHVLMTAFADSRKSFQELENEIRRYDDYDYQGESAGHNEPSPAGRSRQADQRYPEGLTHHGQAGAPG